MKLKKQIVIIVTIVLFSLLYITTSSAKTATVNTDTLKLRKEASTNASVLELLNEGQKLEVIEESGDWIKVKTNGITGFVHKDYIKMEEEKDKNTNNTQVNNEMANTITSQTQSNIVENTITNIQNEITENKENTIETGNGVEQNFKIREETLKNDTYIYILPLINANKMSELKRDTKVIIMDEVKGWNYVQTEGISGWIRENAVEETVPVSGKVEEPNNQPENNEGQTTVTDELDKENPIDNKIMYVNSPSVYVRKGPSTKDEIVDSLILNNQVTVTAEVEDWYKVNVNNKTGYIAKRLLSNTKENSTSRGAEERKEEEQVENIQKEEKAVPTSKGEEIANYAKQYLNCKYVYGGSGPSTFDCSGFTMYVYKHFGINLSHSARAQSKNGSYVSKEDLQLGDLVFFKDYETMDGIGHCGIYIGERKLYSCFFWDRLLCKNFYIIIRKLQDKI